VGDVDMCMLLAVDGKPYKYNNTNIQNDKT
jgi:hypothetical protein